MNDGQDPNQQTGFGTKEQLDPNLSVSITDPSIAFVTAALLNSHPELVNTGFENLFSSNQSDHNREKERIAGRLQGFNPKDNPVWHQITQKFGPNIKQPELLSIAEVLATSANVKLDRDAKRRKTVLIKWFSENWNSISPFLDYVVLEDSNTHK